MNIPEESKQYLHILSASITIHSDCGLDATAFIKIILGSRMNIGITDASCGTLPLDFIDNWVDKQISIHEMYETRELPTDKLENYKIVNNAGDGSCLIHAFLTAMSEQYRNRSNIDKANIGRLFRQDIYANLFTDTEQMIIEDADYTKIIKKGIFLPDSVTKVGSAWKVPAKKYIGYVGTNHGYLYDTDADKLSKCFNMNIIILVEGDDDEVNFQNSRHYDYGSDNTIILYQSGAHFETVFKDGGQYTFSGEDINTLTELMVRSVNNMNIWRLKYPDGTEYSYKNSAGIEKTGTITGIRWGDIETPNSVKVKGLKGPIAIDKLPKLDRPYIKGNTYTNKKTKKTRTIANVIYKTNTKPIGLYLNGSKEPVLFNNVSRGGRHNTRKNRKNMKN